MEVDYNFKTSLQLRHILNIDIPLTSHETSKEWLKCLGQAQNLMSTCKTTLFKHIESVMASAMAPELRTLEAMKKEIMFRSELRHSKQEVNERHLIEYDAMKDDHKSTLEKFFDDCLHEKNKIVKDALYAKAKVTAAVEMANLNPTMEFSFDDMFNIASPKVGVKHKKCLEKMPNSEGNVYFVDFSSEQKRACFDPCGHIGTCIDCGMQQWKRTKRCPLCKCGTLKPLAVPSKLFFG